MYQSEGTFTSLERLYTQYVQILRFYARRLGSNADAADDHVQSAFARLLDGKMPPSTPVMHWLYCVVYREVLLAHRRGLRRCRREHRVSKSEVWFSEVEDRLDATEAACLLAELPEELRETIIARLWDDQTFEEIAEVVVCSAATAYRRYQAGLTQLRSKLEARTEMMRTIARSMN